MIRDMRRTALFLLIFTFAVSCKQKTTNQQTVVSETVVTTPPPAEYPYTADIVKFEQMDRDSFPPPHAVLFVGSSTIRLWRSLKKDMTGITVINRGFGGACTGHILHFYDRIVIPYQPSKIVYYCGDNDIAIGLDSARILRNYKEFITRTHLALPNTKIVFLSNKPSIRRQKRLVIQKEINLKLEKICSCFPFVKYVDIATPMMAGDTIIRNDLFLKDSLHMNEKGYKLWTEILRKELIQ